MPVFSIRKNTKKSEKPLLKQILGLSPNHILFIIICENLCPNEPFLLILSTFLN